MAVRPPIHCGAGVKVAADVVETDEAQVARCGVDRQRCPLIDENKKFVRVRQQPACPCREARIERNVDRAGDMSDRKIRRPAQIDDHRSVSKERRQRIRLAVRRPLEAAENARASTIDSLHLRKIFRGIRLARQHARDKFTFRLRLKRPVESLFVAERTLRNRADPFAA